jgi:hypothetical protein
MLREYILPKMDFAFWVDAEDTDVVGAMVNSAQRHAVRDLWRTALVPIW